MQAAPTAAVPLYDAAAVLYRLGRLRAGAGPVHGGPASAPTMPCEPRSITRWVTPRWAWATSPRRSRPTIRCIASTAHGAGLDVVRHDAAINREFAHKHAQSPAIPQGQGPDDPSSSRRPDGRRSPDRNPAARTRRPKGTTNPTHRPAATTREATPTGTAASVGVDTDEPAARAAAGRRPRRLGRVARGSARRRAGQHPRRPVPPPPRRAAARLRRQRRPRLVTADRLPALPANRPVALVTMTSDHRCRRASRRSASEGRTGRQHRFSTRIGARLMRSRQSIGTSSPSEMSAPITRRLSGQRARLQLKIPRRIRFVAESASNAAGSNDPPAQRNVS